MHSSDESSHDVRPAHLRASGIQLECDRRCGVRLDQGVVDRLVRRDDDAWRWLLTEYDPVFRRALWWASSRIGGAGRLYAADVRALVDDLKVYFFVAFARKFRTFEGEAQFRSFVARTALHFVLERRRVSPCAHGLHDAFAIEEISLSRWRSECHRSSADARRLLRSCMSGLPRAHRAVLLLYHYGGEVRSGSAVARMMGVSTGAAYKRHQRALIALRDRVGARCHRRGSAKEYGPRRESRPVLLSSAVGWEISGCGKSGRARS